MLFFQIGEILDKTLRHTIEISHRHGMKLWCFLASLLKSVLRYIIKNTKYVVFFKDESAEESAQESLDDNDMLELTGEMYTRSVFLVNMNLLSALFLADRGMGMDLLQSCTESVEQVAALVLKWYDLCIQGVESREPHKIFVLRTYQA